MKKIFILFVIATILFGCSEEYDDSGLRNDLNDLENRVEKLEELCKQMNTNISSLQSIVTALQSNDYITSVSPAVEDGRTIGYVISFAINDPITVYHGSKGTDGTTPQIGVKQDGGIYYWTLNGEWLTDDQDNRIKAQGMDGTNGKSAYDLAVEKGYSGTLDEWLASLKGSNGNDGDDGKSAYELAVEKGYKGTLEEWLASLNGTNGDNGKSAYELAVEKGYNGTLDEWLESLKGSNGNDGNDGKSAYELAVEKGYTGTLEEWLESLKGINGITPKLKIEHDYWYVSYNGGESWTSVGKAVGENGQNGDSMFQDVDYTSNPDYVIFTLNNGCQIKLPTWSAFEALQTLCNQVNTNLSSLQSIVTALQDNDYITSVDPLTEDGKVVGYTIKFAKSNPIVIYNGKDGNNGTVPAIGVKKDTDGIYYWTLDGKWLTDDSDNKIQAQGIDGNEGATGATPKLKIENGYWFVSYNDDDSWVQLGKATGEDGKDGDNIFKSVTQDENNVYFNLTNGSTITIPKSGQSMDPNIIQFEDENVKKICVALWDTDGDHELSIEEAAAVKTIQTVFKDNTDIQLFNELKYFTGLTSIDGWAFGTCTNLWRITIPVNVVSINENAFSGCKQLKRVMFEKGSKLKTISRCFYACPLIAIEIPASVESIENHAFDWPSSTLTSVTFEEGSRLFSIGEDAFSDTPLTSIEIPASVERIGKRAFANSQIESIIFHKGSKLQIIEGTKAGERNLDGVFSNCKSLKSIEIPANVHTIKSAAFKGCTALKTVTFETGSKLITIESGYGDGSGYYGAFSNCGLEIVDASACTEIRTLGQYAFTHGNYYYNLLLKIGTKIPPICYDRTFPDKIKIQVPIGCADVYRKADYWKNGTITEFSE